MTSVTYKLLRNNKFQFLSGIILVFIGIFILVYSEEIIKYTYQYDTTTIKFSDYKSENGFLVTLIGIMVFLGGILPFVFDYLQGSLMLSRKFKAKNEYAEDFSRINRRMEKLSELVQHHSIQNDKIASVKKEMLEKVGSLTSDDVLKVIKEKFGEGINDKYKIEIVNDELNSIKKRLEEELKRITRNSNLNLLYGFATSIFAITYLCYSLLLSDDTTRMIVLEIRSKAETSSILLLFLVKFLPRLTVSIFVEIFSFFFLKLYKRNLEDIKYLNNERTNIEMKFIALNSALSNKSTEALHEILIELSKTERNFILKRGETTVEIEKSKTENNFYKSTLNSLTSVFKKN